MQTPTQSFEFFMSRELWSSSRQMEITRKLIIVIAVGRVRAWLAWVIDLLTPSVSHFSPIKVSLHNLQLRKKRAFDDTKNLLARCRKVKIQFEACRDRAPLLIIIKLNSILKRNLKKVVPLSPWRRKERKKAEKQLSTCDRCEIVRCGSFQNQDEPYKRMKSKTRPQQHPPSIELLMKNCEGDGKVYSTGRS